MSNQTKRRNARPEKSAKPVHVEENMSATPETEIVEETTQQQPPAVETPVDEPKKTDEVTEKPQEEAPAAKPTLALEVPVIKAHLETLRPDFEETLLGTDVRSLYSKLTNRGYYVLCKLHGYIWPLRRNIIVEPKQIQRAPGLLFMFVTAMGRLKDVEPDQYELILAVVRENVKTPGGRNYLFHQSHLMRGFTGRVDVPESSRNTIMDMLSEMELI